jgi:hypothetical protein
MTGARYLNAVVFGLTVFAAGHVFRNYIRSWPVVILGTVLILVSVVLFRVTIMAWTESLFILLSMWFVIYLSKFLTQQRLVSLLAITVLAGLASIQRYMGITLVLTGIISIALIHSRTVGYRLRCVSFLGVVATIPVALWLARNYWLTSSLTAGRAPASTSFLDNVGYVLGGISSWLLPVQYMPMNDAKVVLVALSLAVLAALVAVALKGRFGRSTEFQEISLTPPALFITLYTLSLLTATSVIAVTQINDRFLSPI